MAQAEGISTYDDGHAHQAFRMDQRSISLLPDPEDGHTHELIPLIKKQKPEEPDKKDDYEIGLAKDLFQRLSRLERDSFDQAKTCIDYYQGKQWTFGDRKKLEGEDRAVLEINLIKPSVDILSGLQRGNRTDIVYLPQEAGDGFEADVLSAVSKVILYNSDFDSHESRAFIDQTVTGRGVLTLDIDFSKNVQGEIKVKRSPWDEVYFSEHQEYDASDAEYNLRSIWFSLEKLKKLFPDKAKYLSLDFHIRNKDTIDAKIEGHPNFSYWRSLDKSSEIDFVNIGKKQYRLIDLRRKIYNTNYIVFDTENSFYDNLSTYENVTKADINKLKSIDRLTQTRIAKSYIYQTLIAGGILLYKGRTLLSDFNNIPIYANKVGDFWWGKVKDAIGVQDEVNKRHSQMIDVINKANSYGIGLVSDDCFDTDADKHNFLNSKNKPGFHAFFKRGFQNHIHEFQGVKPPNELVNASILASDRMNQVMNINKELLGQQTNADSGIAIVQRKQQSLVGNEFLFDNLSHAKRRLAKLLIEAIQKVYTPERILRILENEDNKKGITLANDPLYPQVTPPQEIVMAVQANQISQDQFQQVLSQMQLKANQIRRLQLLEQLGIMLNNPDLGRYDVAVAERTSSPTTMSAINAMLSQLAANGVPIPPQMIIETMPGMPEHLKTKLNSAISAMQQQEQQTEQQKYQTEIQKSLIAAQSKAGGTTSSQGAA